MKKIQKIEAVFIGVIVLILVGLIVVPNYVPSAPVQVSGGNEPILGGITRVAIGAGVKWTTDLIPSASFTVNLGSSARPVNQLFFTKASGSFGEFTGYASVGGNLFVKGNVGINTTNPTQRVEVNGAILIDGSNALVLRDTGAQIYSPATNQISFFTSASDRIRIDASGNLGIGTSTLEDKLEVVGIASVSGAFLQNSVASNSFLGSLTGPTTGTLSVGTSNNPLKTLWTNILHAVTQMFWSTTTSTTATLATSGEAIYNTASKSVDVYDGTSQRVNPDTRCMAYVPSPLTSIGQQIGKRFLDPFTIDAISPIASPSGNGIGWQLYIGAPGSVTTAVFSANKIASTSSYPKYTSGAQFTIADGQELDIKITSASNVIKQFSVTICGHYTK